jgi:hypothetical protein
MNNRANVWFHLVDEIFFIYRNRGFVVELETRQRGMNTGGCSGIPERLMLQNPGDTRGF